MPDVTRHFYLYSRTETSREEPWLLWNRLLALVKHCSELGSEAGRLKCDHRSKECSSERGWSSVPSILLGSLQTPVMTAPGEPTSFSGFLGYPHKETDRHTHTHKCFFNRYKRFLEESLVWSTLSSLTEAGESGKRSTWQKEMNRKKCVRNRGSRRDTVHWKDSHVPLGQI